MKIKDAHVVLTGAAGGIGTEIASQLAARGARLALVDLRPGPLAEGVRVLRERGADAWPIAANLATPEGIESVRAALAEQWRGRVDCVIHNAGVMAFSAFETMTPEAVHRVLAINVEAPMQLTRLLLPAMISRGAGQVVCVGSMLGALAMPWFTAYSASKFAIRGFAEALRREVAGSGVKVCYIGPRSVRTPLNTPAVQQMAAATGMRMDAPALVAARIVRAIERDTPEVHIGFPERLFARINALLPRLIDRGLAAQSRIMGRFARAAVS
ncbi:MAG: SDR family oxidoreductase [Gammaproteobacteria bacterium]|nr:SDR family oxidoreductase [Gammaproteobacteria bacterium]